MNWIMMANVTGGMVRMHQPTPVLLRSMKPEKRHEKKYLKEQQLKKLEEKNGNQDDNDVGSDEDTENGPKIDEAKVDESNQMDFAKWRSMCVQQVVEALEL